MGPLDIALSHIAHGTTYSWDLTVLISLGIPVSHQLRKKLLAGGTTQQDADRLRALVRRHERERAR